MNNKPDDNDATMQKRTIDIVHASLARRYRAERRFRRLGMSAIVCSMIFLSILFISIIGNGYSAFSPALDEDLFKMEWTPFQIDCPVCNSKETRPDHESPASMRACEKCGSEWVIDNGEITLDARDHFTDEENKKLGRNPK